MTVAIAVVGCGVAGLALVIVTGLVDTPSARARAAAARSYVPRPSRRRVPRSSTFIAQSRHIIEPSPPAPAPRVDGGDEVLVVDVVTRGGGG